MGQNQYDIVTKRVLELNWGDISNQLQKISVIQKKQQKLIKKIHYANPLKSSFLHLYDNNIHIYCTSITNSFYYKDAQYLSPDSEYV